MRENKANTKRNDDVIDLMDLANALLRNWWIVMLSALLAAGLAIAGTKLFIRPTYQSYFTAYINNRGQSSDSHTMTSSDISASRSLASTYAEIIVSRPVVEAAMEFAGIEGDYKSVQHGISVGDLNGTEIIKVKVILEDPQIAYQLACGIQSVIPKRIEEIIAESSMTIVSPAVYSDSRYAPSYSRNTRMGFALGFLLAAGIIIIMELLDNRVKSADEVAERYGIVAMGVIHDMSHSSGSGYSFYEHGKGDMRG